MKTVRVKASTAVPAPISAMLPVAASAAEHVQAAAPHSGHATPSDIAAAVAAHESALAPHTKAQVGLAAVDNTADANKPVSGPQTAAIATAKAEAIAACPAETAATIGAITSGATAKGAPVDADKFGVSDSAASGLWKSLTWASLKASLASYLDGLYARLLGAPGGQTLSGGTGAGDSLTLNSTSHATKGTISVGGFAYFSQLLSRLGIGVSSPTARVHIQAGTAAAGTAPLKIDTGTALSSPEAGAVEFHSEALFFTPSSAAGRRRLLHEGTTLDVPGNHVANGFGQSGNNTNFSAFTFDSADRFVGGGSFALNLAGSLRTTDYFIPVEPTGAYYFAAWLKSGDIGGGNYNATNRHYFGLVEYDRDFNVVNPYNAFKNAGAADTVLAQALNPGDTTMVVVDASGWNNNSTIFNNNFTWWPYVDSSGYSWPAYTYTRNASRDYSSNSSLGAWVAGAISGATITLRVPWAGPALPAGTPVRNCNAGNSYLYLLSNGTLPNAWTEYAARIIGTSAGTPTAEAFRAGTRYVRPFLITNSGGSADNVVRVSCVRFAPLTYANHADRLAVGPTYRQTLFSALPTHGLAVEGRIGGGTLSPAAALHVIAQSALLRLGYDTSTYLTAEVASTGVTTIATVGTAPALAVAGDLRLDKTITQSGTTGAQTIHKQIGSVNLAAGQSSVVVTNNRVTTSSVIVATVATADATLKSVVAVAANGSFTLTGNAAATAETRVNFLVLN